MGLSLPLTPFPFVPFRPAFRRAPRCDHTREFRLRAVPVIDRWFVLVPRNQLF